MTNDDYQRIAREERRRQEQEAFQRRAREDQERQQREQRARTEAQLLRDRSRRWGEEGSIPPFPARIDATEYQKGLWEYQQDKRREEEREERAHRIQRGYPPQQTAAVTPTFTSRTFAASRDAYAYQPPKRGFIGGITRWFINHAWPFSALFAFGRRLSDASSKVKALAALIGGVAVTILLLNSSSLSHEPKSTGAALALAFGCCALLGWFTPALFGVVLRAVIGLIGITLELAVYGGVIWLIIQVVQSLS